MAWVCFIRRSARPPVPVPMVLYTRRECPLCLEMKAAIDGARLGHLYVLREVDVDEDRALQDEFGWRVPVLEIAGELALEGRCRSSDFERRFESIAKRYQAQLPFGQEPG